MSHRYIYLHGFASSPQSSKAQFLKTCYAQNQINLIIPDLNPSDFALLTLTNQLQQVQELIEQEATPVTLIGSSFGGLTSALLGEKISLVTKLILLAPAFNFTSYWSHLLSPEEMTQWQYQGYLPVYHYGFQKYLALSYNFWLDLSQYNTYLFQRDIPTLILHGIQDQVIPISSSQDYATYRPWVQLKSLDSDHNLTDVLPQLWEEIQKFSPP